MQTQQKRAKTPVFTASEVAEFEYCPLAWWHEQFGDWTQEGSDELFARLVELEEEHGTQAPDLPEYRLIEQLLLRQGAFERGREQHREHAEAVEGIEDEIEEDQRLTTRERPQGRILLLTVLFFGVLALLLLGLALLLH